MLEEHFDADEVLRDLDEEIPDVEERDITEEELEEIDFDAHQQEGYQEMSFEDDGEW